MKKIVLILLSFLCLTAAYSQKKKHLERVKQTDLVIDSLSQYYTITEEGLLFSRVIQAPDFNKDALFVKILEIFSSVYVDSKVVIDAQDKEQGVIIGKGSDSDVNYNNFSGARQVNTVHHAIKVEVREGRFKVSLTLTNVDMAYYDIRGIKQWEYHHPIFNFYPFSDKIKLKYKDDSFNTIKFSIINANALFDRFEQKVIKEEGDNDW